MLQILTRLTNSVQTRGGELGTLRVREHPLSMQVHPLTDKSIDGFDVHIMFMSG